MWTHNSVKLVIDANQSGMGPLKLLFCKSLVTHNMRARINRSVNFVVNLVAYKAVSTEILGASWFFLMIYLLILTTVITQIWQWWCNFQKSMKLVQFYNFSREVSPLMFGIGPVNALWSSALYTCMQFKTIVSIIKLPKVDVPNLITYFNRMLIFQWHVVRCGSNNGYKKRHVCEQDWTTCSKYGNHSKFNSQYNWAVL